MAAHVHSFDTLSHTHTHTHTAQAQHGDKVTLFDFEKGTRYRIGRMRDDVSIRAPIIWIKVRPCVTSKYAGITPHSKLHEENIFSSRIAQPVCVCVCNCCTQTAQTGDVSTCASLMPPRPRACSSRTHANTLACVLCCTVCVCVCVWFFRLFC